MENGCHYFVDVGRKGDNMHREASVCGQTTEIQIGIPYFLMSKMETWGLQESLVPWCSMALEWFW